MFLHRLSRGTRRGTTGTHIALAAALLASLALSQQGGGGGGGRASAEEDNPLLDKSCCFSFPRFEDIRPHHVQPAVERQLVALRKDFTSLLREIEAGEAVDYESIVEKMEEMRAPLSSTLSTVDHLLMVNRSDDLIFAHNLSLSSVFRLYQEMSQSEVLLQSLQKIKKNSVSWEKLSETQQRVVNINIRDMQRNGVDLSAEEKEKLNRLNVLSSALNAKFDKNLLKSSRAFKITLKKKNSVESMPYSLKSALAHNAFNEGHRQATPEEGPWVVLLDASCYFACMQHLKSRKLREVLYRAYSSMASSGEYDNTPVITAILENKRDMAGLLGFKNYAELSLEDKMASSVGEVMALFHELRSLAFPFAEKELIELKDYARRQGVKDDLEAWDIPYWSERMKEEQFGVKEDELKAYFPFPSVLKGLFRLIEQLFSVRIEEAKAGEQQVWHPDVSFFRVYNTTSKSDVPIAAFYLDPYCRPGRKKEGNWMNPAVSKSGVLGTIPVAYLVLNLIPPNGDDGAALLTLQDLETLFHEMGHCLQHVLTTVECEAVSGVKNICWDAIEFPSQFMENFVYDKNTIISRCSQHHLTGEPLPENLFDRMQSARLFQSGQRLMNQLYLGAVDLELHSSFSHASLSSSTPHDFVNEHDALKKFLVQPLLPGDKSLCSFSHIFTGGYSAGYYSYIWAEVMSADAFDAFESDVKNGRSVSKNGLKFRDTVLAMGGRYDPGEVFVRLRGRPPTAVSLLKQKGLLTR